MQQEKHKDFLEIFRWHVLGGRAPKIDTVTLDVFAYITNKGHSNYRIDATHCQIVQPVSRINNDEYHNGMIIEVVITVFLFREKPEKISPRSVTSVPFMGRVEILSEEVKFDIVYHNSFKGLSRKKAEQLVRDMDHPFLTAVMDFRNRTESEDNLLKIQAANYYEGVCLFYERMYDAALNGVDYDYIV